MTALGWVYLILFGLFAAIGGLNWGLVGVFDFDLVAAVFGDMSALARIIYVIVGLAAVYQISMLKPICTRWDVHFHRPAHT